MYKITIPKPCHENWDEMLPNEQGRHCLQCCKTVVDFTILNDQEVQNYFLNHQGKSLCGRFKTTQLNEIIVEIKIPVVPLKTSWNQRFKIAAFLVFGTFLFSCTNSNNEKITKIVATEQTTTDSNNQTKPILTGDTTTFVQTKGDVCLTPVKESLKNVPTTLGAPVIKMPPLNKKNQSPINEEATTGLIAVDPIDTNAKPIEEPPTQKGEVDLKEDK